MTNVAESTSPDAPAKLSALSKKAYSSLDASKSESYRLRPSSITIREGHNIRTRHDADYWTRPEAVEQVARLKVAYLTGAYVPPIEFDINEDGSVLLGHGEHRLRAAQQAEIMDDSVRILANRVKIGSSAEVINSALNQWSSNNGLPLSPLSVATLYGILSEQGMSNAEIARTIHKSAEHVRQHLLVDAATPAVKQMITQEVVSFTTVQKMIQKHGHEIAEQKLLLEAEMAGLSVEGIHANTVANLNNRDHDRHPQAEPSDVTPALTLNLATEDDEPSADDSEFESTAHIVAMPAETEEHIQAEVGDLQIPRDETPEIPSMASDYSNRGHANAESDTPISDKPPEKKRKSKITARDLEERGELGSTAKQEQHPTPRRDSTVDNTPATLPIDNGWQKNARLFLSDLAASLKPSENGAVAQLTGIQITELGALLGSPVFPEGNNEIESHDSHQLALSEYPQPEDNKTWRDDADYTEWYESLRSIVKAHKFKLNDTEDKPSMYPIFLEGRTPEDYAAMIISD